MEIDKVSYMQIRYTVVGAAGYRSNSLLWTWRESRYLLIGPTRSYQISQWNTLKSRFPGICRSTDLCLPNRERRYMAVRFIQDPLSVFSKKIVSTKNC